MSEFWQSLGHWLFERIDDLRLTTSLLLLFGTALLALQKKRHQKKSADLKRRIDELLAEEQEK